MHVFYSFPHVLDRPGIAVTALNQVLGLSRMGARVTLFCAFKGRAVLPPSVEVHETLSLVGRRIPHKAFGVQRAYDLHDMVAARWLARHPKNFDIVHAWPRGCLRTLRAAREADVVAVRESPNPHTASVMRASRQACESAGVPLPATHSHAPNAEVLGREVREYAEARHILVPSGYAMQEFLREGVPAQKLLQHRYGCDLSKFFPHSSAPSGTAPLRLAFVGRGDPTKGLHVALHAWEEASLPGAALTIAGRIEPEYGRSLSRLLRLPGVEVAGFVHDVPALLAKSDVLLLSSWTEGSALVTYEAQASGCVPFVSRASGAFGQAGVDFVEHEVGAASELATQLTHAADDRGWLQSLSHECTRTRWKFSWDEAAISLESCYLRALAT